MSTQTSQEVNNKRELCWNYNVAEYKVNIQNKIAKKKPTKSIPFLYTSNEQLEFEIEKQHLQLLQNMYKLNKNVQILSTKIFKTLIKEIKNI